MARRNRRKLASKNNSKHADKNNQGDALPENDLSSAPQEKPPILIDKKELRDSALERAKNRPIRERIMAFFRREKIRITRKLSLILKPWSAGLQ